MPEDREQNIQCVFSVSLWPHAVCCLFQSAEVDQNTGNRVTSWPQAQTAETAAAIKTEVVGLTIKTPYELIMIQIMLFAPDADNPF